MRQFVLRIFFVLRQLLNPCLGPIAINGEDADVEAERTALRSSVSADPAALQTGDSTDDESSAVRLSRRSSVLVDLISLFRRSSSSIGRSVRLPGQELLLGANAEDEIDLEETKGMSKERVLEAIRQKKEVITKLRSQPWSMKRKLRTLKVARRYLQRQKLKVSKWHLWKAESLRRLTQFGRWCDNMKIYLIPWEAKIKGIESRYGSVVSSYFTFLRWVLSVNITMTVIMMLFVTIPEWLADSRADPIRYNKTYDIKVMKPKDMEKADELNTVLDFKGYFEYSLMFYGYYSSETYFGDTVQYSVPVAYFIVNLFILGYSFFVILRKMASNARNSKLSGGKTEQYVFNWKLFTGWDYTIGNPETATNVVMANVNKFREVIAEYNVNMKKKFDCLQFSLRIFANILVFLLQAGSVWAILEVSQITDKTTFIERNAVSITVSFITLTFPNFYDLISKIERYHPRTTLRLQLARVLFLYIVNYYTLIVSLMFMLNTMESQRNNADQPLFVASQFSDESLLPPFVLPQLSLNRSERQVRYEFPANLSPFNDQQFNETTTTPVPTTQWTTVLPKFGPFAVANPNVVVSSVSRNLPNSSSFYTRPIGRTDWSKNVTTLPIPLNYSTSVRTVTAQRLTTDWYEECWENLIGQEITKLVTMDLVMTIASILVIDFLRGLWVRYCNLWWFWNLECTFPEYGEFKVAENVLHLVNNQGMIWLGLFFVPMLPAINNIKLIILMYVRAWAVMTCNVPARQIFRASRSSNFYLMLLLLMLFLCTLPVGYVIASKKPSKICGPFGSQPTFYSVITQVLHKNLSRGLVQAIRYMVSPGIVIPVLLLLLLIIYFLFALVRGLREANTDLSNQLMHERTDEKKKIFELAGGGKKKSGATQQDVRSHYDHHFESNKKSLTNNHLDDERSTTQSQRSRDPHSFIPSLTSVSEEAQMEQLDDAEQQHDAVTESPPLKLNWKQRLLVCIGWTDLKRIREQQQQQQEQDTKAKEGVDRSSPVSGMKSTEPATSEDQRSYSWNSGSYSGSECHSHSRSCSTCPIEENQQATTTRDTDGSPTSFFTGRESSSSPTRSVNRNGSNTLHVPEDHYHQKHSGSFRADADKSTSSKHHKHHLQKPSPQSSDSSQHTVAHDTPASLLEPLRPEDERLLRELQHGDDSQICFDLQSLPPTEEDGFSLDTPADQGRQPSPTHDRRQYSNLEDASLIRQRPQKQREQYEYHQLPEQEPAVASVSARHEYLGLSDPRIAYADPYSSYANAMMSPILELQQLGPTIASESDAEDDMESSTERTHLISNHSSKSKEKDRKRAKEHHHNHYETPPSTSFDRTETMVKPPRFRISASPKRKIVQSQHSQQPAQDSQPRQFVMRVKPSSAPQYSPHPQASSSAATTPPPPCFAPSSAESTTTHPNRLDSTNRDVALISHSHPHSRQQNDYHHDPSRTHSNDRQHRHPPNPNPNETNDNVSSSHMPTSSSIPRPNAATQRSRHKNTYV